MEDRRLGVIKNHVDNDAQMLRVRNSVGQSHNHHHHHRSPVALRTMRGRASTCAI